MLVQHRATQPFRIPFEDRSRMRHRTGNRRPLLWIQASEIRGHGKSRNLRIRNIACDDALNEPVDDVLAERLPVPLPPNHLGWQHHLSHQSERKKPAMVADMRFERVAATTASIP